jgi:hypothetical protein
MLRPVLLRTVGEVQELWAEERIGGSRAETWLRAAPQTKPKFSCASCAGTGESLPVIERAITIFGGAL